MKISAMLMAAGMAVTLAAQTARADGPLLQDRGPAAEFTGITHWLNSPPLTMAGLRGKVVLVDFWAYSCINCLRTLPYLTRWAQQYKDMGLVVVGVHAPEFKFEEDTKNVAAAIDRFHITYPVAQDNNQQTWNAFKNEYWPEEYLIDRHGRVVYVHAGEGHYDETENAIRMLVSAGPPVAADKSAAISPDNTPETYFGIDRIDNMVSPGGVSPGTHPYTLPDDDLELHHWAIAGTWTINGERATLAKDGGKVKLHCQAAKVFMVAGSKVPNTLQVVVDGKRQLDVTVSESRLYTLFESAKSGDHVVEITIPKAGLSAFTFTFG